MVLHVQCQLLDSLCMFPHTQLPLLVAGSMEVGSPRHVVLCKQHNHVRIRKHAAPKFVAMQQQHVTGRRSHYSRFPWPLHPFLIVLVFIVAAGYSTRYAGGPRGDMGSRSVRGLTPETCFRPGQGRCARALLEAPAGSQRLLEGGGGCQRLQSLRIWCGGFGADVIRPRLSFCTVCCMCFQCLLSTPLSCNCSGLRHCGGRVGPSISEGQAELGCAGGGKRGGQGT
mmetsp:Transcript_8113/g.20021  ORF Transcript_8113/g.20021 Transcript_8113/m.20021 type:complete len:226 (-) Transcript_8113:357-1034(-)